MNTHAIVPVKPFERAKTRLARALAPEARRILAEAMLRDVLAALRGSRAVGVIWVVSHDRDLLGRVGRWGAEPLEEKADLGLNPALRLATRAAMARGARRALIVPSDIPLLRAADVRSLLSAVPRPPGVAAVASRDGGGTNALLRTPPDVIAPCFGRDSFARHARLAARRGVPFVTRRIPRAALDIDTPSDLLALARRAGGHTAHALARIGFV
jgi:2-phospho-L-lactate guanylyltransferase